MLWSASPSTKRRAGASIYGAARSLRRTAHLSPSRFAALACEATAATPCRSLPRPNQPAPTTLSSISAYPRANTPSSDALNASECHLIELEDKGALVFLVGANKRDQRPLPLLMQIQIPPHRGLGRRHHVCSRARLNLPQGHVADREEVDVGVLVGRQKQQRPAMCHIKSSSWVVYSSDSRNAATIAVSKLRRDYKNPGGMIQRSETWRVGRHTCRLSQSGQSCPPCARRRRDPEQRPEIVESLR